MKKHIFGNKIKTYKHGVYCASGYKPNFASLAHFDIDEKYIIYYTASLYTNIGLQAVLKA